MKKKLILNFVDFSDDFNKKYNFFLNLLEKYYDVEISDQPDMLFYSNFGVEHLKYKCKKVFYSGENIGPNYFFCDYAFSFEDTDEKNFFLPHFVEFDYFFDVKDKLSNDEVAAYRSTEKDKFCNFMASNYRAKERISFVKALMQHKRVDCLGPVLYNMGERNNIGKQDCSGQYIDWRKDKLETVKSYKFSMAFENEQAYNYVTEKIFQPFVVGSIPIYWGANNIDEMFNPKCFVNVNRFHTFEEAIDEIIRIDADDTYYQTFFEESPFLNPSKLSDITEAKIVERIETILTSDEKPVGKRYAIRHTLLYYILNAKLQVIKIFKKTVKKLLNR